MSAVLSPAPIEHTTVLPFEVALVRLRKAIADAGLTLFAEIDHAAGAASIGVKMARSTVLIYGHPRGGTPIMLAFPDAALDLPLRALLREEPQGNTVLVYDPIATLLRRSGVPESTAHALEPAQNLLITALRS
jgi:uncharacterized protein (DUF302 family)